VPHVLLGVTGGIAAYKALELVRLFRRAGWPVTAVMTRSARKFVGPESFRALTGRPVALDLFPRDRPPSAQSTIANRQSKVAHVDLATSADLVVIAPATANIIGKVASGIADDLLSTILLAVPQSTVAAGRVLFAPAMNVNMWLHPSVQANMRRLSGLGYRFVEPGEGELACGTVGPGRLAEPAAIFDACRSALARVRPGPLTPGPRSLSGLRVLVTAGRTEEPLDAVRVITNRSSGRMGTELARAFAAAGAHVRLVAGEMSVPAPEGLKVERTQTTAAMQRAVLRLLPATDVLVMCAAVADYRPARASKGKLHDDSLTLRLERTPDILKEVSRRLSTAPRRPYIVGFSLDDSLSRARAKLEEKKLDLIVANPFATAGSGTIRARLIFRSGRARAVRPMSKPDFARLLVETVTERCNSRKSR
jgi:phosphopantothenoylcysteine decarboxylase/phosphopantothenate--cysteine ligase